MSEIPTVLEELLRSIIRGILHNPDDVKIERAQAGRTIVFSIVCQNELGWLLGREGETIWAIRRVMHVAASRYRWHVTLEASDGREPVETAPVEVQPT